MDYGINLRGREFAASWERCAERWIKKGNDLTAKRGAVPPIWWNLRMKCEDRTGIVAFTKTGKPTLIRPLRPTDRGLVEELFKSLSPRSIFFRFHGNLQSVPPEVIACVMKLDCGTDVAMVALEHGESEARVLGLCGIRRKPESERGEFTVVVRDDWQGIGVGAKLVEVSLPVARDLGMKELWGIISPENTTMIEMANKLGFTVRKDPESGYYEMRLIF